MAYRVPVYVFLYFFYSCFIKFALAQPVGQCPLPALGPACETQSAPWITPVAGNPINLINGNKYLQHADSYPLPAAPLLFITRHYNSLSPHTSILGLGWTLHWDIRLYPERQMLQLGDGRTQPFKAHHLSLLSDHPDGQYYALQLSDRTQLRFNRQGYLTAWVEQDKGTLLVHRYAPQHSHLAHHIKALQVNEQQLVFHYRTAPFDHVPLLHAITGPFGKIFYQYELLTKAQVARLTQVYYPDGRQLIYHYEQEQFPQALTGISLQLSPSEPQHRIRYWWYDSWGRAFFSAHSEGREWIRIEFEPAQDSLMGRPIPTHLYRHVYSARGHSEFEFHPHQQRWQLRASRGVPCPGCPPVPLAYEEHESGQQLHWDTASWYHHPDGTRQLHLRNTPWPDLQLLFNPSGELRAWDSTLTGRTEWHLHPDQRQLTLHYANEDKAHLYWDEHQQPQRVEFIAGPRADALGSQAEPPIAIEFFGLGSSKQQLTHPHETQWWQQSAQRIRHQSVRRHLSTNQGSIDWHYEEHFDYDEQGRLSRHHLFEGGTITYDYDDSGHLRSLLWHPREGAAIPIISRQGSGLWRHHNHVYRFQDAHALAKQRIFFTAQELLSLSLQQDLSKHQQAHWQWHANPESDGEHSFAQVLLYDHRKRLVGAQQTLPFQSSSDPIFWAWDELGQNIAHSQYAQPMRTVRDSSGLIRTMTKGYLTRPRQLSYNSQRRLAAVYEDTDPIAHYQHNAFGYRIYAHYPKRKRHHFYIFHQQRLVAEWSGDDTALAALTNSSRPHPIQRRYVYLGDEIVAFIDYEGAQPMLYAVHSNEIGAPILITDSQQNIVWQAQYHPLGHATIGLQHISFQLRLPGQYEDPVTGWHDNLLRTYDPKMGHYLEPDPLGPMPGQQPLGYAAQQPWRFIDPLGLLLFAFDGTRYDARLASTIWQMSQAYEGSNAYYQPGPGNPSYLDWDALTAWNAHQILHTQWQHLLNELLWLEPGQQLAINVIGFSRGAALARHFANQIIDATQGHWFFFEDDFGKQYQGCIAPHFMGLFDTVAQFGILGSQNQRYDLSIAPEWAWVAHAVALNEYRQLYPLYDLPTGERRVQAGFIGNHGTMGGGQSYTDTETPQGDLHKVPLAWMLWQASALELSFSIETPERIEAPVLHDARPALLRRLSTDRHVQDEQSSAPQWLHPDIGQPVRQEVETFIERYHDWQQRRTHDVGTVRLSDYYQWLDKHYGWQPGILDRHPAAQGKEQ